MYQWMFKTKEATIVFKQTDLKLILMSYKLQILLKSIVNL